MTKRLCAKTISESFGRAGKVQHAQMKSGPGSFWASVKVATMKAMTLRRAGKPQSEADSYVKDLLEKIEQGKTILQFRADEAVFSQGDSAEAIYFIQTGKVKIIVASPTGKEAVLKMLGPHGFFGEGCMVGQTLRVSSAIAIQPSTLFRVERRAMLRALHAQRELSEKFTALLLSRNIDLEEDLITHSGTRIVDPVFQNMLTWRA